MNKELRYQLKLWAEKYETKDFIKKDPIQYPRMVLDRFPSSIQEVETSAIISSWLSFGKRTAILKTLHDVHDTMGFCPHHYIMTKKWESHLNSKSTLYRFFTKGDFARLCERLYFIYDYGETVYSYILRDTHQHPMEALIRIFRGVKGFPIDTQSACKRINLLLRWMARSGPVDMGVWGKIPATSLLVPVDTHVHGMALELGITKRSTADMRTCIEITNAMKQAFPFDPARGDFALFGYGVENDNKNKKENKNDED